MTYRAPKPGEVLAEVRAMLSGGDSGEQEQQQKRYVLRYTRENIGGVTVIVGMVERDAGREA